MIPGVSCSGVVVCRRTVTRTGRLVCVSRQTHRIQSLCRAAGTGLSRSVNQSLADKYCNIFQINYFGLPLADDSQVSYMVMDLMRTLLCMCTFVTTVDFLQSISLGLVVPLY